MMTLDIAIAGFEHMADHAGYSDEERELSAFYDQLAEWLRELKRFREEKKCLNTLTAQKEIVE